MKGISTNELAELLKNREPNADLSQGYALLRDGTKVPLKDVREVLGRFEGRAGTMRRSRKGRTYPAANGRRYYVPGDKDIIAYKT